MLFKYKLTPFTSILLILIIALLFAGMRLLGTLGPKYLNWLLPLGFCMMAALPWLILSQQGRSEIGLQNPVQTSHIFLGISLGALAAFFCFLTGKLIFGNGIENWFVSIGNNYQSIMDTRAMSFFTLNLIFTLPAMLFSPIGEEIFFRGIFQKTLEQKFPIFTCALIESAFFALVHLAHHGILKSKEGFEFLPISASLWVLHMFGVALMFAWLRSKSGSIYVCIASHSAFNLTMNLLIFKFLWFME